MTTRMYSFLGRILAGLLLITGACGLLSAGEFKLKDGTSYTGDIRSMAQRGVIIRYETADGTTKFTPNIAWEKFSQETLNEFYKDEKARVFVELLIQMPKDSTVIEDSLATMERAKKPPIEIKPSGSPGLISVTGGFIGTLLGSGIGKFFALAFYLLNLFAAYEVAVFRRWERYIVVGAAAVIPVIPTIVFLSMPTRIQASYSDADESGAGDSTTESASGEHAASAGHETAETAGQHGAQAHSPGHSHAPAGFRQPAGSPEPQPQAAEPAPIPATQVFRRGECNINRRFIETKFAGFFRIVPSDAEKDLYLVMKTARGEFLGKRVCKITTTDISIQLAPEAGGAEETFPLNDIFEIQIRHKDAPAQ